MVDTLVLGTSAQAWEFESLHAQTGGYNLRYALQFCFMSDTFYQDIWSEGAYIIARANARSNPAFANFARSEAC